MKTLLKRDLFNELKKYLDDNEIIVIHGARQVGKTSLMQLIMSELDASAQLLYIDLEERSMLDLCNQGTEKVIDYLKAKMYDLSKRLYLFIDEIQYLDNPSSFLKLFYDRYGSDIKLVVSGSSSFAIKSKFTDSLTGRILDFELFPLSFNEFLNFRGKKFNTTVDLPDMIYKELCDLYNEFCIFGGYPAIVLEPVTEKKEKKLNQIINTYLKADIRDLGKIRDLQKFNNFIRVLSSQNTGLLKVSETAGNSGIVSQTAEDYLFILENTFILKRIYPFHTRLSTELTRIPKLYFEDNGVQNLLENRNFTTKLNGFMFENAIFSEFRKRIGSERIKYWRKKNHLEIDFIIEGKKSIIPVEVKLNQIRNFNSLNWFSGKYDVNNLCLITLNRDIKINNSKNIRVYLPWEIDRLLLENDI